MHKKNEREFISLSAQIGGEDAYERTNDLILQFRKLLARHCVGEFSSEVDEFAIILRIDGNAQKFGFQGPRKPIFRRKQRFVEIEIGVPKARWACQPPEGFEKFLSNVVDQSVHLCISKLGKSNVSLNTSKLLEGLRNAKIEFLSK
jgi:hypothetical protein